MLKVKGSSIAVPARPPMPGTIPRTSPQYAAKAEIHKPLWLEQQKESFGRRPAHEGQLGSDAVHQNPPRNAASAPMLLRCIHNLT